MIFKLIYVSVAFLIVALYLSREYSSIRASYSNSSYAPPQRPRLKKRKTKYSKWRRDRYGLVYPYPNKLLQTRNRDFIVDVGTFAPPISKTKISQWYVAPPPCLPETTLIIGYGLKNRIFFNLMNSLSYPLRV